MVTLDGEHKANFCEGIKLTSEGCYGRSGLEKGVYVVITVGMLN